SRGAVRQATGGGLGGAGALWLARADWHGARVGTGGLRPSALGRAGGNRHGAVLARVLVGVADVGRLAVACEAEQDDRDVVLPAVLVGRVDQPVCSVLERGAVLDDGLDVLLGDHRGEPVGAEEGDVAVAAGIRERLDFDARLGAERARDDRTLGVVLGLLGAQAAL